MKMCSVPDCGKRIVALGWCRKHYLRMYRNGSLVNPSGRGRKKGFKHSAETIEKCRTASTGKKQSPETIEKRRQSHLGRKNSPETIIKMRLAALGRVLSPETRAKISEAGRGKVIPQEVRGKISAALKGRPKDPEHAAKVGLAQKGSVRGPLSEETRMKQSISLTGHKVSAATREKIRQANLGNKSHFFGQPQCNPEGRGKRTLYAGIWFRSTYEARFAAALDTRGIKWEYEPTRFNLGSCTFLPDFYLPEENVYWEIKGWFNDESQLKAKLFREQYPDIPLVVATEPIIKMMEV